MFIKKSKDEIIVNALEYIVEHTEITNMNAGSIARSIVESIAGEYETLYEFAEDVLYQGYLSRATNEHLDLIGTLFNYERRDETIIDEETGEHITQKIDDETYRYELSKRVQVAVSSNEEALRLSCLAVSGVQDIIGKEYTHGSGSFSFILIEQYGFDPEIVSGEVQRVIEEVKAFGVRPNLIMPEEIPLELDIQLLLKEGTSVNENVHYTVESELMNYFGNFSNGQDFIYNEFVSKLMNSHESIRDFKINGFYLNNTPVLLMNHQILDDERIRPKAISIL